MKPALLDTDMLSEVIKRKSPKVRQRAAAYLRQHVQFAFSSFTRYEALRGLKERAAAKQCRGSPSFAKTH